MRPETSHWIPAGEASLTGQLIDAFEILELIGRGGMGEVYKARDVRLDRLVAIKITNPLFARDPEFVGRFEREARAASALSHPNVAQVYWTGRYHERPFYAMEYVDGRSLAAVLLAEGKISGLKCLDYLAQAAEGLRAAHAKGIIHRDIKPANLMVGKDGVLKIVDFGLARRLSGDATLTQSDCVLGTPRYMSPEQALGGEVDHRSDIYSLGATFYHLFAGQPPFDAETPIALMMKHVQEPLPPLRERNPHVPGAVCGIVELMLAKRPEDRYQSYDQLLADVRLARGGRLAAPISSITGSPERTPAERTLRSGKHAFLAGGILAVAGAVALIVAVVVLTRPSPESAAVRPRQSQSRPVLELPSAAEEQPQGDGPVTMPEPSPTAPASGPVLRLPAGGVIEMAFRAKTLANMRQLSTMLQTEFAEREELPSNLAQLSERYEIPPEALLDGWNREILYERVGDRKFRLTSLGSDGLRGTDDDLVIDNGRVVKGQPEITFQP